MQTLKKFKYGIFDVDGTIVDIMPIYMKTFSRLLKDNFGISKKISEPYYLNTAGTVLPKQFQEILKNEKISADAAAIKSMVDDFFAESAKQNPSIFPGISDVLESLAGRGIKLFAMTGSDSRDTVIRFKRNNVFQLFSVILGSEKIPKGPAHIEEFAKFCKVSIKKFTNDAFMCGDGPRDMEIAKQCGIFAIGITNTVKPEKLKSAGADIIINNYKELLN